MRRGTTIFAMTATALALAAPVAPAQSGSGCANSDVPALDAASRAKAERALRCLIDRQRSTRGAPRLTTSGQLKRAAVNHVRDMNRRNYFSHTSRGGSSVIDRVRRTGYLRGARNWRVGETIAFRLGARVTARDILAEFLESRRHTQILRSSTYRHIGLGWSGGSPRRGRAGETVVAVFGRR